MVLERQNTEGVSFFKKSNVPQIFCAKKTLQNIYKGIRLPAKFLWVNIKGEKRDTASDRKNIFSHHKLCYKKCGE